MKIIISKSHEESSQKAAMEIVKQVIVKPDSTLGFATGSSPLVIYKNIIECFEKGIVSFKDVTAFNLDEYVGLSQEDENSYYYFMRKNLFNHIDIDTKNCHIPNNTVDLDKMCEDYEDMIKNAGGIDIQLLGIGTNAHIGFNEPSDEIAPITHIVNLTQSTIDSNSKYFKDGNMPTKAMTMGLGSILRSKKIILIANGKNKAEAIKNTVHGPITPKAPASLLQLHPDAMLFLDEEAASLL